VEEHSEDLTPEYFREVLLSYRLIFGQDKDSWKTFCKKIPTFGEHWDRPDHYSDDADPMLRILCCSKYDSPNANQIYEDIDAVDDVSPYYYPDSDFPFLGRRILDLQAFVRGQSPRGWRALWNDRHNVGWWWTFWATFFIGGGIIFLEILQAAFLIWGGISSLQQVDWRGGSSNSRPTSCP
jgi:hypothetical protein